MYKRIKQKLSILLVNDSLIIRICSFRGRDYDWVRHYLTEYALRLAAGNYAVVSDSLSVFHDVLCTDMNTSIILLDDDGHESAGTTNACRKQAAATVDSAAATAAAVQPTIQIRNTEPDQPAAGFVCLHVC